MMVSGYYILTSGMFDRVTKDQPFATVRLSSLRHAAWIRTGPGRGEKKSIAREV
jgi:hypothetical protein